MIGPLSDQDSSSRSNCPPDPPCDPPGHCSNDYVLTPRAQTNPLPGCFGTPARSHNSCRRQKSNVSHSLAISGPVTHAPAAEQGCPLLRGPLMSKLYAMVSNRTQALFFTSSWEGDTATILLK